MLSCIENGTANPSLATILYIAGRLNVPAGFLLAEEGDEIVYRKMSGFANIKRAYTAGDYRGCRSLSLSGCPEPDDEIGLLLSDCDAEIAIEEFDNGRLRSSCRFFDEALSYAEKTMYRTDRVRALAALYFRYMQRISPTLYSDMIDPDAPLAVRLETPFAGYVDALDALDRGERAVAERFLDTVDGESFYAVHIRGRLMMEDGNYSGAERLFSSLLAEEEPLNEVGLYTVFCELEICCRELENFKDAYRYANEKVGLLEQLLKDVL